MIEVSELAPESGSSQQLTKNVNKAHADNGRQDVDSHNYLHKRLKIYNMFRGNEVSRANSADGQSPRNKFE